MWARLLPIVLCACAAVDGAAPPPPPGAASIDDEAARRTRAGWVRAEILRWNAGLAAADRADKLAQMAESPIAFYRGTDHLFWADLSWSADLDRYGVATWIGGDLHVDNLGSYNDDTGTVVFGMTDFDEAVVADYQLDVWRLATSLILYGRDAGLDGADIHAAVDAMAEAYLDQLDDDRHGDGEAKRRFTAAATTGAVHDLLVKQAGKSNADLLAKWTTHDAAGARVLDPANPDLGPVDDSVRAALADAVPFAVKSVARRRHAGLGSLGVERYYVLVAGPSGDDGDDVILDVKAEPGAAAYAYVDAPRAASEGERAATAERALDVHVDDRLGWLTLGGRSFVVRALSPAKGALPGKTWKTAASLAETAAQLGRVVATFHARGDEDFDAAWVAYDFERAVHDLTDGDHAGFRALVFARAARYADRVAADWAAFRP